MLLFLVLTASVLNFASSGACTLIYPPINATGSVEIGVVLFPGDSIDSQSYTNYAQALAQKLSLTKTWLAIAQFPSQKPTNFRSGQVMDKVLTDLTNAGFSMNQDTPFFFIGHSVGGNVLQDYLIGNFNKMTVKLSGLVLEGSYIQRKNYANAESLANVLTIGAELDGLVRITRVAESYYFDSINAFKVPTKTVVLAGMNHYQFTGDNGIPPASIAANDFKPEISNNAAVASVTNLISAFVSQTLNIELRKSEQDTISELIASTENLLNPIVEAFKLEGSYNYNLPCYQSSDISCTYGSPWSPRSQQIMGTRNVTMKVTDQFFPAAQVIPDPLPIISNKCIKPYDCVLNATTVTELIYTSKQISDIASDPQGAIEMRTKLSSRQNVLLAATGVKQDFNKVDAGNLCGEINAEVLKWAVSKAPKNALDRYFKIGRQLRIGDDRDMSNLGPLWIWTPISYNDKTDNATGTRYTEVAAPTMKFDVDYWISLTAGFHFCKVLSPARAVEWIYFDSLKV